MKKEILVIFFIGTWFAFCGNKPSFNEQVQKDFSNRVQKIDSAIRVDSFRLIRRDSLTEMVGQIVFDSLYAREEARLEAELGIARQHQSGDTSYRQEEINYMKKELDSIQHLIAKADTVKKYGVIAQYFYTISKNDKSATGGVYYFISNKGNVLNPDMIMDSLKVVAGQLR